MAGMKLYSWESSKKANDEVIRPYFMQGPLWKPVVGQKWMHVDMHNKLRITSPVVSYDPESGVVVTQNSVYVRG